MKSVFPKLSLILALGLLGGCDSSFMGSGGNGLGGSGQPFKGGNGSPDGRNSGDQNGQFGPNGPFDPNNPGDPNNPFGDGGDNGNNNGLNNGDGSGETTFSDATLTVVRADSASEQQYNHNDVQIRLKAGSQDTQNVAVGKKGLSATLTGVCTQGKPVEFDLTIIHRGRNIKPNKQPVGGIMAYRLDKDSIMVGYELEAIGRVDKAAWHENDDWIATITCNLADNGDQVEIKLKDTCFDQRIPRNGQNWIGKTDDADSPTNRVCSSTN